MLTTTLLAKSTTTKDDSQELYVTLWGNLDKIHALADDDDRIAQFLAGLHALLCHPKDKEDSVRLLRASAAAMWYPAFIALTLHFREEGDEENANRYADWAAEEGQFFGWALDYSKCNDTTQWPFAKYRFNERLDRYTRSQRARALRPDEEFAADLLLARFLLAAWHAEHQLTFSQIERLQSVTGTDRLPFTRYVAFRAMAHDVPTLHPDWATDLLPTHAPIRASYREVLYEMGCKAFHEGNDAAQNHWKIAAQFGDPLAQRALQAFDPQHGRPLVTERRSLLTISPPTLGFDDVDWSALYQDALHQSPDVPTLEMPHWHLTDWLREHLRLKRRKV
ncbi:MAG: hypothetical protein ABTR07_12470 [Candidatus Competibacter denitrificans]